ncbi:DUF6233 domain-containing protein [Streptomyces sp. NPDC052687]|uniref:DUF6233 domain-containing protein n=1 Tax=Streptomyces sp. NPDC052687 TaxID=3154759 RepID=UPI00344AEBE6
MNDLPPDAPRLHAILRHLDAALAESDIVRTYLEVQRRRVLAALREAEGADVGVPPQQPTTDPRGGAPEAPFKIGRVRSPDGPVARAVHLGDCHLVEPLARGATAQEARTALVDGQLDPCGFCRPDAELGIDSGA